MALRSLRKRKGLHATGAWLPTWAQRKPSSVPISRLRADVHLTVLWLGGILWRATSPHPPAAELPEPPTNPGHRTASDGADLLCETCEEHLHATHTVPIGGKRVK